MNPLRSRPITRLPTAAACALALLAGLAGCETQQQVVAAKEDSLAAAGFTQIPANTPERVAMLRRLLPNRFLRRVRADTVSYVYADPLVCECLYVGSQQAYGQYRAVKQQEQIANEQALAAEQYSDPQWNWGGWGGGNFGPSFGIGGGF